MDFIAHDFWSSIYLVALVIAGVVTFRGSEKSARRILHILIVNWLVMRCNVHFFEKNEFVFVALGVASFVALILYGRSAASYVCAFLFLGILNVDFALRSGFVSYRTAGELWDALAFAVLLIMAGASNDFWSGRFSRLWRNGNSVADTSMAVRRDASERPTLVDRQN